MLNQTQMKKKISRNANTKQPLRFEQIKLKKCFYFIFRKFDLHLYIVGFFGINKYEGERVPKVALIDLTCVHPVNII